VSVASYIMRTMDFERTETGRTLGSGRSEDELGLESDWLHQARIAREHARRRLESHAAQPAESRGPAHNSATGEFWIQTRRYLFEQEKLFDETLRTIRASDAIATRHDAPAIASSHRTAHPCRCVGPLRREQLNPLIAHRPAAAAPWAHAT